MEKFKLTIFEGCPLIHDGNNIMLVDTGAPQTIHTTNSLNFLSEHFQTVTNFSGLITVASISALFGTKITTLLGTDILSKYNVLLDYQNAEIWFSKNPFSLNLREMEISAFMNVPIIEATINNKKMKFYLDTGAYLSYISDKITGNYESLGIKEDFFPTLGKFTTPYYEIETNIFNENIKIKYGNLPDSIQTALEMQNVIGVIGFDFLSKYKFILDIANKKISIG
ncbi:MAG: retroviral-like aspartic protease family protein [Prevotellaceae bacterium]|jgi:hypothetical protein|nr:retroviral-like aspartic protease family protein [Prevotellaceae bacterium]